MGINKKTIYILIIVSTVIGYLYYINCINLHIPDLGNICLNVFCGCLVSIILCLVNYFNEKRKIEINIFNQAQSYYACLWCLYILSSNFLGDIADAKGKQSHVDDYKKLAADIRERNHDFFQKDHFLDCFIFNGRRKKMFDKLYEGTIGNDFYSNLDNYMMMLDMKEYTIDEIDEYCNKDSYDELKKIDAMLEEICNKYLKEKKWNDIKKEDCIGFFKED